MEIFSIEESKKDQWDSVQHIDVELILQIPELSFFSLLMKLSSLAVFRLPPAGVFLD